MDARPNTFRALQEAAASVTRPSEPIGTAQILGNRFPKPSGREKAADGGESEPSGTLRSRTRNDSKPSNRYAARIGLVSKPSESVDPQFGASRSLRKTGIRGSARFEPVSKGDGDVVSLVSADASPFQGSGRVFSGWTGRLKRSGPRVPLVDTGVAMDTSCVPRVSTRGANGNCTAPVREAAALSPSKSKAKPYPWAPDRGSGVVGCRSPTTTSEIGRCADCSRSSPACPSPRRSSPRTRPTGSTPRPSPASSTLRREYEIAASAFAELLPELRRLVEVDLAALEEKLEDAGAPWTPGRGVPEWEPE